MKKFNCFPKQGNSFSVPTRSDLLPILEELSTEIVNTVTPVDEMIERIGNHIGSRFRVNVKHADSQFIEPGEIDVNGYYDSSLDEHGKVPIEMVLISYPDDSILLWDQEMFVTICRRVADTIVHELVHMKQARSRDFLDTSKYSNNSDEEAYDYLCNFDEIDAYAHNIASEILELNDQTVIHRLLEHPSSITLDISPNLWGYINAFNKDVNHPVLRRLMKKIYKNIKF